MLKWTAGLAVAGVVGIGLGYSASELLRPVPPTPEAVTETSYVTVEKEQSFIQTSIGGVLRVYVRNDRVTRVEPVVLTEEERVPQWVIDAKGKKFEQPHEKSLLYSTGQAYRRWIYSPKRLRYPMKRVGWEPGGKSSTYDNRGVGDFVRITWEEALDTLAKEMKRLKETYGNSAILSQGSSHKIHGMLGGEGSTIVADKLFNTFGGTTKNISVNPSQVGHKTGASFVYGYWAQHNSSANDFPSAVCLFKDLLADTLKNSNLVVYWGWDGTTIQGIKQGHEQEFHMRWIKEAGIKTVSISPTLNEVAAYYADKWISIPPGYDVPLALAIAYVWFKEDTWDKKWVSTHAVGVEKFQEYVLGVKDGIPKSPEWAEKSARSQLEPSRP